MSEIKNDSVLLMKDVTMQFGGVVAVNNLSLEVKRNQIVALIGPNGAGKSTTMNIMTGCLAATAGTVKINGFDKDKMAFDRLSVDCPELVDEKYKCYAGYWDIWFYKMLHSGAIEEWNDSDLTFSCTYGAFSMHDHIVSIVVLPCGVVMSDVDHRLELYLWDSVSDDFLDALHHQLPVAEGKVHAV